jgi:molybdopterin molybdotransferase
MPPFDKATMDGYAVRFADVVSDAVVLPVQAEVTAGRDAPPLRPGHAIRIMTGAPVPAGADAVVRVELSKALPDERVELRGTPPRPGNNILPRAQEMKRGDIVLTAGSVIQPQTVGLLATVGRAAVRVRPAAEVAVLVTGDELVDATEVPGPAQLRNSNGPMLAAQAVRAGATVRSLGVARDTVESLGSHIQEGLQASILVLSGGVSAGKLDLVPGVLAELGVQRHFHQVAMKPGKPLFFGSRGDTLVFGLPGNPVSSFCGFELFVRPAIRNLMGQIDAAPPWTKAELLNDFTYATDRPTYHPATLEMVDGVNRVRVVPWVGSSDLRALTAANALLVLPAGNHTHGAGQFMLTLPLN